jgi:hypothetical protein
VSRHGYTGARVPALLPVPLHEGWTDAALFRHMERLYRRPWWKHALYVVGWGVGRALGRRPGRKAGGK